MRLAFLGLTCMMLASCREIQPVSIPVPISGYQLNGRLAAINGAAIDSAEVRLFYNYELYDTSPTDTAAVVVKTPTQIVDIAVYTDKYAFVRQLFLGYLDPGPVQRARWSGLDYKGNAVKSGKYYIRYVVDTVIVKYSAVLVDGAITAHTDYAGKFTISGDNLPVGDVFDFYRYDGGFYAAMRVLPDVALEFRKLGAVSQYPSVQLLKNEITTVAFTL